MAYHFSEEIIGLARHVHVNLPWKYLPRYLEMVMRLGINVEIGFEAQELDKVSRRELTTVAGKLQERGHRVTLHSPFWDLSPGSIDPLVRSISRFRLQQFFDIIDIFRPIQVVCHTGFDPRHHQGHRDRWLENSQSSWEPLVVRAERLETPLLLENVWERGPELHKELFERIRSPYFGFCLDAGHQHSFSETSWAVWLEILWEVMKEIHLHDNDGTRDAHLPIGQGSIDFAYLFMFLGEKGHWPLLTLEPHHEEHVASSLEGLREVFQAGSVEFPRERS